ncbi:unnamed protein product [Caenorhabditis sp. 36 PRJEB53466]|nr:unnamed protein product [Caenorhabditis sp. 36 PRJEB53466]
MLIRNWKDFNSGFFRIVIADYCFNLFTYLNSMVTLRVPNGTCKSCALADFFEDLGKENQNKTADFLYIFYFFHFGNAYFQYSMTTLMSLNRATSIFFYFSNEKIWKVVFPTTIGLMIVIAVWFTRTILASVPYYMYNESLDIYSITADTDILSAYWNVIRYMAFAVLSSVILNTSSVMKLKLMQQKLSTVERNLLFATITSSFVQCAAAANTFLLQLDLKRTTLWGQFAQLMLPFSSDFLTISQPYILIFLSSKVRTAMANMYFSKNSKVNVMFTKTNE